MKGVSSGTDPFADLCDLCCENSSPVAPIHHVVDCARIFNPHFASRASQGSSDALATTLKGFSVRDRFEVPYAAL